MFFNYFVIILLYSIKEKNMERIKALYGRQSIDKKDSISIETQLKYGKNICELNNWTCKEYYDKGYSGSNMDRPDFKKLLRDIKG